MMPTDRPTEPVDSRHVAPDNKYGAAMRRVVKTEYIAGLKGLGERVAMTLECGHVMNRNKSRGVPLRVECLECQKEYSDGRPSDGVELLGDEEWKTCLDFPGYRVSSWGRMRGAHGDNYLRPAPNERGYLCVNVRQHGKLHRIKVHRQVAKAFCPNPDGLKEVNHEDGVKTNNTAANLKWCTRSENLLHKWRVLGHKHGAYALMRMKEANTGHLNHSSLHLFLNGVPVTCKSLGALCGRSGVTISRMIRSGMTPEEIVAAPKIIHRNRQHSPTTPTLHLMQSVTASSSGNDGSEREDLKSNAEINANTEDHQINTVESAASGKDSAVEKRAA